MRVTFQAQFADGTELKSVFKSLVKPEIKPRMPKKQAVSDGSQICYGLKKTPTCRTRCNPRDIIAIS